ncbi:hypothetical protein [Streptosporangium oxazolinicum]|uniref:hypothetical protein n=1 Tax=Streptosporangium oxazolinicum TaxID=909287 RepID=UPI0031F1A0FC
MTEKFEVPPEVLEVFKALQRAVDATVAMLETRSVDRHVTLFDEGRATDSLSVQIVSPDGIASAEASGQAVVANLPMPTVAEVSMARAWLEGAKALGHSAEALAVLEGLMQLAERVHGLVG